MTTSAPVRLVVFAAALVAVALVGALVGGGIAPVRGADGGPTVEEPHDPAGHGGTS